MGIATDGGFLTDDIKKSSMEALNSGLNIDSGLHEYISDIPRAQETAAEKGLAINDIRKDRPGKKHAFTGKIREVRSCRIAVLGTDSCNRKADNCVDYYTCTEKLGEQRSTDRNRADCMAPGGKVRHYP